MELKALEITYDGERLRVVRHADLSQLRDVPYRLTIRTSRELDERIAQMIEDVMRRAGANVMNVRLRGREVEVEARGELRGDPVPIALLPVIGLLLAIGGVLFTIVLLIVAIKLTPALLAATLIAGSAVAGLVVGYAIVRLMRR